MVIAGDVKREGKWSDKSFFFLDVEGQERQGNGRRRRVGCTDGDSSADNELPAVVMRAETRSSQIARCILSHLPTQRGPSSVFLLFLCSLFVSFLPTFFYQGKGKWYSKKTELGGMEMEAALGAVGIMMLGINQCLTVFDANFLSSRTFPVSGFVGFKMHGLFTSKIICCVFLDLSIPLSLSIYGFVFVQEFIYQ